MCFKKEQRYHDFKRTCTTPALSLQTVHRTVCYTLAFEPFISFGFKNEYKDNPFKDKLPIVKYFLMSL